MKKIFITAIFLCLISALVFGEDKISVYGFLKLDTSLDSALTDNPDAPKYVKTEDKTQFAMTAMNTRIGLKLKEQKTEIGDLAGKIELDFYDTASDNSQKPRMRHAYVKLKNKTWKLLAGQTWDVFGPLAPNTVNTNGFLWYGGNIGFRRPQIRLTNMFSDEKLQTEVSLNRSIGTTALEINSGEYSGLPVIEARASYKLPLGKYTSVLGLEMLYGKEKFSYGTGTADVSQNAVGLDFELPVSSKVTFRGEFFQGANLDAFLAGVGQGVNGDKAIDASGGWVQATYKKSEKSEFNFCYGYDNPDNSDLNNGNIAKNAVLFGNMLRTVAKDVKLGIEYANFKTDYLNSGKRSNNRITLSLIYNL